MCAYAMHVCVCNILDGERATIKIIYRYWQKFLFIYVCACGRRSSCARHMCVRVYERRICDAELVEKQRNYRNVFPTCNMAFFQ